jgi:hypothetical protein
MRKTVFLIMGLMAALLLLAGCGGSEGGGPGGASSERTVIGDYDLPIYPGGTIDQELGMSTTFTTDAGVEEVESWYDQTMEEEGWRSNQEWSDFGGQDQKIFFQGEQLANPDFGDRNVIVGVGPNGDGGVLVSLAPILNRYQGGQ